MPKLIARGALLALLAVTACVPTPPPPPPKPAPALPVVGGATMYPNFNFFQNTQNSKDHTTLVAALNAAGLAPTLSGTIPYTVFAPTNVAFARLPNGTVDALMHPRSRPELVKLLNYHLVPGTKTRSQIQADVQASGGTASYRTAQGGTLRVQMFGGAIAILDMNGRRTSVTQADVTQSNGVMHVVDNVLLPAG